MSIDQFQKRREERERSIESHKAHLAKEHGLKRNAKFDAAYSIAWDHGHSSGFNEVANYFADLLPLLDATELAALRTERDELREALKLITNLTEQVVSASPVALPTTARILERARAALEKTKP